MRNSTAVLATIVATTLAGCAAPTATSYPAASDARLATYARATPCCDDPSGFNFSALPKQGNTGSVVDASSPVFDFQSGVSPFAAFVLPDSGHFPMLEDPPRFNRSLDSVVKRLQQ